MVAQSGVNSEAVPVPPPGSVHAPELEMTAVPARVHQLHSDLEALGLTSAQKSNTDAGCSGDSFVSPNLTTGDETVGPKIRQLLHTSSDGEDEARFKSLL